jgi:Kef-type K+ transport system membrane component KefB
VASTPTADSLSERERKWLGIGVIVLFGIILMAVLVLGHYAIEEKAFTFIFGIVLSIMSVIIIAEFTSSLRRKILVAVIDGFFLVLLFPIYLVSLVPNSGQTWGLVTLVIDLFLFLYVFYHYALAK